MEKKEIIDKVNGLKYKDETVKLSDVYPSLLESLFDFYGVGISPIGGRDLDYEGETSGYHFLGSAYYGTCTVTKKHGKKKPKEAVVDTHTRKDFMCKGRMIENVPPAILLEKIDEELRRKIADADSGYKLWYISFVRYGGKAELYPFYAKDEWDVRHRALSIWGQYDDIKSTEYVEECKEKYGDNFKRFYGIRSDAYVLVYEE
jgi:hypothetical protein